MDANVGNPLAKSFHTHAHSGLLDTHNESLNLVDLVNRAQMIAYWENSVARICSQFAITADSDHRTEGHTSGKTEDPSRQWSAIIPRTIVCGTVTRRAVERTWLTASNPRSDRIGSELKCMVRTPEDHCFVGADVDSQEMWIAALLGDALTGVHGSSACSWMLLNGSKSTGNDLHSHIANTIGITRDHAKVLNYARIYGAGAGYATRLLCAFNPKLALDEAKRKVALMYRKTKGVRRSTSDTGDCLTRPWHGGSESDIFNALERIAVSDKPCTPVLGARMTRALEPRNVGDDFMTSRINWVVQSSAVDYLAWCF